MCSITTFIRADIPVPVAHDDTLNVTLDIEFSCRWPWTEDGDADPELELHKAILVDTEGPEPTDKQVAAMAKDWLDGPGFLMASEEAARRLGRA